MKDEKKYYIEVSKNDFMLSEILKIFGGFKQLSEVTKLSYSTIHHNFHYKGISNLLALKIDKCSNGKFQATELVGMKFSKNSNFKYLK